MTKNDWYDTGEQLKKLVQDAVEKKDFTKLGDTIENVVNQTVEGIQSVIKESISSEKETHWDQEAQKGEDGRYRDKNSRWEQRTNREAAERIRRNIQKARTSWQERGSETRSKEGRYRPAQAKLKVPGEASGRVMKWFGYSMSTVFALLLAIFGILVWRTGFPFILAGFSGLCFAGTLLLGIGGSRKTGLARRFRRYHEIIGERTYCMVEELASGIGQTSKYVKKDLKKMIQRGYFKQAYLDRKETLLITDRETYQQYLSAQTEYERREMENRKRADQFSGQNKEEKISDEDARSNRKNMSDASRELLEEGQDYICHVHRCNEIIEDEEMSAKLDRLELVITRIFHEAEKNPDIVDDLKKMMSYYLPTTRKLLDAYCELDAQPIRGQNIENTKKEIEAALDTINVAFENLLDSLFEETAWDISSDISVLHTMLKQEGLAGKDFEKK